MFDGPEWGNECRCWTEVREIRAKTWLARFLAKVRPVVGECVVLRQTTPLREFELQERMNRMLRNQ